MDVQSLSRALGNVWFSIEIYTWIFVFFCLCCCIVNIAVHAGDISCMQVVSALEEYAVRLSVSELVLTWRLFAFLWISIKNGRFRLICLYENIKLQTEREEVTGYAETSLNTFRSTVLCCVRAICKNCAFCSCTCIVFCCVGKYWFSCILGVFSRRYASAEEPRRRQIWRRSA